MELSQSSQCQNSISVVSAKIMNDFRIKHLDSAWASFSKTIFKEKHAKILKRLEGYHFLKTSYGRYWITIKCDCSLYFLNPIQYNINLPGVSFLVVDTELIEFTNINEHLLTSNTTPKQIIEKEVEWVK